MITYADITIQDQVRRMWKTVFGDPDSYIDLYFREKYRDENTLVYMEGKKVTASLQMLPYDFTFCGTEIPVAYLSGVCTLPEYRKKGYMAELLIRSFLEMHSRGTPLVVLVPQEKWLLEFYDAFGFAQTFDPGTEELPSLKELIDRHQGDLHAAFREFNTWFRQKDMTVQKSYDDFRVMVEEASLFGFPPKKNLIGMARVIDVQRLLSVFADRYVRKRFSVTVYDDRLEHNNTFFTVQNGGAQENSFPLELSFHAGIRELSQLLLGYHTSQKKEPFRSVFPEKTPQLHFMLE